MGASPWQEQLSSRGTNPLWLFQLSLHCPSDQLMPVDPFPYLADALFLSFAPSQPPKLVTVKAEDVVEMVSGLGELCVGGQCWGLQSQEGLGKGN